MDHIQRVIAMRVICAYRTTSFVAATLLARIPPLYMMAGLRARVYERVRDLRQAGEWNAKEADEIRKMETVIMERQWKIHMQGSGLAGERTRTAILPIFDSWIKRDHGNITFRVTQLLTGHGCFGTYLCRIGSVPTPLCEHCEMGVVDSAEHTIQACGAWTEWRGELRESVGEDLTHAGLVKAMCEGKEKWIGVSLFAERVMGEKEMRERRRQAEENRRGALSLSPESAE